MFISRKVYDSDRMDLVKAREEARVLSNQNQALQAMMDWFRFRLTQVEKERAILVEHYLGIKIPVPEVAQEAAAALRDHPVVSEIMKAGGNIFADVGDHEAKRLGVDWPAA